MSRFSGKQSKGASRAVREQKRNEAEARNARTPLQRTRLYRQRMDPAAELLSQIFAPDLRAASPPR